MASRIDAPSIPKSQYSNTKRPCLCSPTTHPGSFRCSLHKKPLRSTMPKNPSNNNNNTSHHHLASSMAAAKANSLMKAFLLQVVIKPSSHDLHRRKNFQPKPTRFCLMNGNNDAVAVS